METKENRSLLDVGLHVKWLALLTGGVFILALLFGTIASFSNPQGFASGFFGIGAVVLGFSSIFVGGKTIFELVDDFKDSSRRHW